MLMNMSSSEISKPLIEENVMETTKIELPFRGFTKTAYPKVYEQIFNLLILVSTSEILTDFAYFFLFPGIRKSIEKIEKSLFFQHNKY